MKNAASTFGLSGLTCTQSEGMSTLWYLTTPQVESNATDQRQQTIAVNRLKLQEP